VTPKAEGGKLRVTLAKVTFSVKVSSTPPGASITVGSKPMGFTPTTVKLPAFEASTLKIVKDGFHRRYPEDHAEAEQPDRARDAEEAAEAQSPSHSGPARPRSETFARTLVMNAAPGSGFEFRYAGSRST